MNDQDIRQAAARGISPETLESQLRRFKTGFPYLETASTATPGRGILVLDERQRHEAEERWEKFLKEGGTVTKFVPASGAASRMFKALYAFAEGPDEHPRAGTPAAELLDRVDELPFRAELDETLARLHGLGLDEMRTQGRERDIARAVVEPEGMNYGALPKGLLTFHRYAGGTTRTPLEEQMAEGAQTAAGADGRVSLHFTVSHDHKDLFAKKIAEAAPAMEKRLGVKFDITTSEQSPATDTVAAEADGTPFRDAEGRMVFRPGGHGALIHNLSQMPSEVVFIKNIDNVVPDGLRGDTVRFKRVIAGELVLVHDRVRALAAALRENPSPEVLLEAVEFMQTTLNTTDPRYARLAGGELAALLLSQLDRPLRVCGMVRNEGEPGGGPFLARNADGSISPQILESTQIDPSDPESVSAMKTATHFNPVDLVCWIRDLQGRPYRLEDFTDPDTGFISDKSFQGRPLRALELPGLWNGAMSRWNTVFVEVPATTFNPVKTVNDLLRPAHQAE